MIEDRDTWTPTNDPSTAYAIAPIIHRHDASVSDEPPEDEDGLEEGAPQDPDE